MRERGEREREECTIERVLLLIEGARHVALEHRQRACEFVRRPIEAAFESAGPDGQRPSELWARHSLRQAWGSRSKRVVWALHLQKDDRMTPQRLLGQP
eukprot:3586657-Rhodomonas_salina.1